MKLYDATLSEKLQTFQYRLTYNIMGTNSKLYKWGMRLSNKCGFCKHEEKTTYICFTSVKKFKHSGEKLSDGYKRRLILISTSQAQRYYWVHRKISLPYLTYFSLTKCISTAINVKVLQT